MERVYKSQEACPIARTLDILGDRWTMLVLRDLFRGLSKFGNILESLKGISPNLLADRLKRLEQLAIVERIFYNDHPPRAEYHLTDKGRALRPILHALAEWGIANELSEEQKADPAFVETMARMSAESSS
ncbi:MAG: helix-turn-helix transcriptional regulator [Chloroflexi bacterium]|nr:helix-turn-helix transcriptional regulator [Chloroflexota bacterium]MCI0777446.1 helix-turn-helix transcriptional regulator [Chloroflexota bacterium]